MLDEYQLQLTRLLEYEKYEEAKELLRFLLKCQGDERQHAIEWGHLLHWLEQSFPAPEQMDIEEEDLEAEFRRAALTDYGAVNAIEATDKLINMLIEQPSIDKQLLALERAVHLDSQVLDEQIIEWLEGTEHLHPSVQFKALQCLKKRGTTGIVEIVRFNETIELEIEATPLNMNDFPASVNAVYEKVLSVVEASDVTLTNLVGQLWMECLELLYGSRSYQLLLEEEEYIEDCFAAALHHTLVLIVYGESREEEIRELYGITYEYRFRYEQVSRTIRDVALIMQEGI